MTDAVRCLRDLSDYYYVSNLGLGSGKKLLSIPRTRTRNRKEPVQHGADDQ